MVRVGEDGTAESVVEGLMTPNGIAFDDAGSLYVAVNSATFGPPPAEPQGQVLRCDDIAAAGARVGTVAASPASSAARLGTA